MKTALRSDRVGCSRREQPSQGLSWLWRIFFSLAFTGIFSIACRAQKPAPAEFSGEASGKVVLRVSGLPSPSATDPVLLAELRVLEEFQRRFPHIELRPAEGIRLENVATEVSTIMMVAGGIAPDVLIMNFRSADTFVRNGMVAELDSLLDSESAEVRKAILERIPGQVLPVVKRSGPQGGQRFYGLPVNFLFSGLYFNKEIFRKVGLPMRAPEDWEEMVDFARRIKQHNPGARPISLAAGTLASWNMLPFLWSAGGEAVALVEGDQWRTVFNSPEAVTAYEFYYRIVEAEQLVVRVAGVPSRQDYNRTGVFFGYVGNAMNFDPRRFGFGPVPRGSSGQRGAEINARVLGIFSGATPEKKAAAWEYIKFQSSEEAERIKVQTLVEAGMASQVNPVFLRKYGYEAYLKLVPAGLEEAFQEALKTGRPEPYGKNCNLVYAEMSYPIDQMLLSTKIAELWQRADREGVRREIAAILDRAVRKTNERMLGFVPPRQMNLRRAVAVVVPQWCSGFSVGSLCMCGGFFPRPVASKSFLSWLCLAPAAVLTLAWSYVPLARGTVMAFQDYKLILKSTWAGIDNFANVLFDATFWNSLLATLHYAAWTLTAGFLAPILLAYALHLIPRHKVLFRLLYYLPAVISAAAVFFLWRELFGAEGLMNQALRFLGFEAQRAWTEDPHLAMLSCVITGIWAGTGPGCLIYLAALKITPPEQFEAAEIDGAGFFDKTRLIVFPGIKALILINFTGAAAAAFHGATNILIMTGGGPNGATEVTSLLLFFEAFTRLRFGHATAMAWIIGSMLIGFTVLQLQRLSNMEFKTAR
jgi:multiple sugar transport system permease protein